MFRRTTTALALLLALAASAWAPAWAQGGSFTPQQRAEIVEILRGALKSDPSILMDAITAMQENEGAHKTAVIRSLAGQLERNPGDPVAGNPNGDVTIVEFSDVRCPYCRRMLPVLADLLKRDANIRLVHKELPVLGPSSVLGAKAVLAAQKQGGYFKMHDALMTGSPNIDMDAIQAAARRFGLDGERLKRDMEAPDVQARINENLELARKLQIRGTPAYLIGAQMAPGALEPGELQDLIAQARRK